MSEYQYYEFRAVDRPLNQKEMDALRALSTRAEITPTSFTNEYNYGDFRGKPETLMERYFDAFVYVANWGTRRLMFRIPRRFLDADVVACYVDDEAFSLRATGSISCSNSRPRTSRKGGPRGTTGWARSSRSATG